MKLLIIVHNLIEGKAHLMPWRTVCEVTRHLKSLGHNVTLISMGDHFRSFDKKVFPSGTYEIRKSKKYFKNDFELLVNEINPELIFWPLTWRESKKRSKIVMSMNIPVVGWFPGGVYSVSSVLTAGQKMGLRDIGAYIIEAFSINLSKIGLMKQPQVSSIITMTQTTADVAKKAGWTSAQAFVVPPGKENAASINLNCGELSEDFSTWLKGRKYYLFMGPPSKIRGIYEVLDAFEIVSEKNNEICLVCLFRSDGILDRKNIKSHIESMKNNDRIYCAWQSLSPEGLNAYKQNCFVTIMPFLLVPSEIPLAIIETMAWGKPVITTKPGGTGDFVEKFGTAANIGDIDDLANTMIEYLENEKLYIKKCKDTVTCYKKHPDWITMAVKWLKVAEKIVNIGDK